jgi:hypothetical protein
MSTLYSARAVQDATLQVSANFGSNANSTSTNAIDLGSTTPWPASERIMLQISTTVATGANNKNVNIALQHSDVNTAANFANVNSLSVATVGIIPETNGNYVATTWNFYAPPGLKRYIRLKENTETSGGAANDGTMTLKCLF